MKRSMLWFVLGILSTILVGLFMISGSLKGMLNLMFVLLASHSSWR